MVSHPKAKQSMQPNCMIHFRLWIHDSADWFEVSPVLICFVILKPIFCTKPTHFSYLNSRTISKVICEVAFPAEIPWQILYTFLTRLSPIHLGVFLNSCVCWWVFFNIPQKGNLILRPGISTEICHSSLMCSLRASTSADAHKSTE